MTVMLVVLSLVLGLALGYLVRRWHRPVGYVGPDGLLHGEWRVHIVGGVPYHNTTIRAHFPVTTTQLVALTKDLQRAP